MNYVWCLFARRLCAANTLLFNLQRLLNTQYRIDLITLCAEHNTSGHIVITIKSIQQRARPEQHTTIVRMEIWKIPLSH